MTLNYEEEETLSFDAEALAKKVILHCLDFEQCPYESEVNLLLTSDAAIKELNKQFREMDKSTDVLSFPMISYETAADFSIAEDYEADYFNPETGELLLGDIVISKDKVISQADAYGHSVEREFSFLVAHSMLHLMGYDHMEEDAMKVMEEKQARILEELTILR